MWMVEEVESKDLSRPQFIRQKDRTTKKNEKNAKIDTRFMQSARRLVFIGPKNNDATAIRFCLDTDCHWSGVLQLTLFTMTLTMCAR